MRIRTGSCLCGDVKYQVAGEPARIGLCHCTDCRKESGSAFVTFAIWPRARFRSDGDYLTYDGRSFCPSCGARLFNVSDSDVEIRVGSLDSAPSDLAPAYELWIKRREHWIRPLESCEQFTQDRPAPIP